LEGEDCEPVFEAYSEAYSPAILGMMEIDGIDINQGLRRFAYDEEAYLCLLRSYLVNTRPLLDEMTQMLAGGDLEGYTIVVHGIKGTSFGMGAFQAGEMARLLEQLASAGEAKQLVAKNEVFVAAMESLLDSIEDTLALFSQENKKPYKEHPEPSLIQELRDACHAYDVSKVDAALAQLESFTYERDCEALVAWLRKQIDEMNYDLVAGDDWPFVICTTKTMVRS